VVERALILTDGPTLAVDPQFPGVRAAAPVASGTLREVEREYILDVLAQCGGKVAGPGNAAARLGLNRSTLLSRMKKLGIDRGVLEAQKVDGRINRPSIVRLQG
jgi:formate hydrogenlyase transcriptional activator